MKQNDLNTVNSIFSEWLTPPEYLTLGIDEVHVWRASIEMVSQQVNVLKQILSVDELIRADRFYFQKDRDHFIVARGLLRLILSRYLDIEAREISFYYGPFGKPAIEEDDVDTLLRFNISHSGDLALFAFAQDGEVGVDLEYIRSDLSVGDIAGRFFSNQEAETLNALPEHDRHKAFFVRWTRIEAYLKAQGKGLSVDFNDLDRSLNTGNHAELLEINGSCQERIPWLLTNLDVEPEYAAALAVEGNEWQLRFWQCNSFLGKSDNLCKKRF